jgi:hypothetical protein
MVIWMVIWMFIWMVKDEIICSARTNERPGFEELIMSCNDFPLDASVSTQRLDDTEY